MQKNPGNKADLKNPEIAVVVEVIRGICLLSIAPYYYKFKKYNLLEICSSNKTKVNICFLQTYQDSCTDLLQLKSNAITLK